jgi:hypothetical protein
MAKKIKQLEAQIRDLQAFCGVLTPVFEKEYRKGKWNWKSKARKGRR